MGLGLISQVPFAFYFFPFPWWFQTLGHQAPAAPSEATQPPEAPTVDPEQQRLIEEQQRRQEAVLQKDRVSFAVICHVQYAAVSQ